MPRGRWLLLVIVVALVPRLLWLLAVSHRLPEADEIAYIGHAQRLSAGRGYVTVEGRPTDFWPPGYPLALAAVFRASGGSTGAGLALQTAAGVATPLLVWLVGRRVASESIGRVAAIVIAVYPNHVVYSALWLGEPLATLAVLSVTVLLMRNPAAPSLVSALGAGVLIGYVILSRPMLAPLLGLIPAWQLRYGHDLRRTLVASSMIVLGALLVVGPWMLRNHRALGRWSLSTSGGYNFLVGNHAGALGGYRRGPDMGLNRLMPRTEEGADYRRAWSDIRRVPGRSLLRIGAKISYFIGLETDGLLWTLRGLPRGPLWIVLVLLAVVNGAYVLLVAGALLGLIAGMSHRPFTTYFYVLTGCLVTVCAVYVSDPRYHYIAVPFAAIFMVKGVLVDWPALREGVWRRDVLARRRAMQWGGLTALAGALMIANLGLRVIERRTFPRRVEFVRDRSAGDLDTRERATIIGSAGARRGLEHEPGRGDS
jgi:hypothetical protein